MVSLHGKRADGGTPAVYSGSETDRYPCVRCQRRQRLQIAVIKSLSLPTRSGRYTSSSIARTEKKIPELFAHIPHPLDRVSITTIIATPVRPCTTPRFFCYLTYIFEPTKPRFPLTKGSSYSLHCRSLQSYRGYDSHGRNDLTTSSPFAGFQPKQLGRPLLDSDTRPFHRPFPDRRPPASGLYLTELRTVYFFDLMRDKRPGGRQNNDVLTIGTNPLSDLQLPRHQAEHRHALLERHDGTTYLIDNTKDHDTFIDGWQLVKSAPILVGMIIHLGGVQLIGTNARGTFPISVESVSELCRKANELVGSLRAAGSHVGRSHNFVRKQFLPRSTRYKTKN